MSNIKHDRTKLVEEATKLFQKSGFNTGIFSEIEATLGIKRTSIYSAFSNKEGLLKECLESSISKYEMELIKPLEKDDAGLKEILGFFKQVNKIERATLLFTIVTSDESLFPEESNKRCDEVVNYMIAKFLQVLKREQKNGVIPKTSKIKGLSRYLFTTYLSQLMLKRLPSVDQNPRQTIENLKAYITQDFQ